MRKIFPFKTNSEIIVLNIIKSNSFSILVRILSALVEKFIFVSKQTKGNIFLNYTEIQEIFLTVTQNTNCLSSSKSFARDFAHKFASF